MKKTIKIISFILILSLSFVILLCLSGCNKQYEYGDFYYYIDGYNGERYISIGALTKQGETKEKLIIPDCINGLLVKHINGAKMYGPSHMEARNVSEIIFGRNVDSIGNFCINLENPPKIICYNAKKVYANRPCYLPYDCVLGDSWGCEPANISFLYNFEGAENNGFYVVDNEEIGSKIEKPINPTRLGYTFDGWYKDKECSVPWDFENDIIEEEVEFDFVEMPNEIDYKFEILNEHFGTLLYAKWI